MSTRLLNRLLCGVAVTCGVDFTPAMAQVIDLPPDSFLESQINRHLETAEKTLESTARSRADIRQKLASAALAFQRKQHKLEAVHKQVYSEHDNNPELVRARNDLHEAENEVHNARKSVLSRLSRESADYQKALAARQEAGTRLRTLPAESASTAARQSAAKALMEAMTTVTSLEQDAIQRDAAASDAHTRLSACEQEVATFVAQRNQAIETDPRLSSAKLGRDRTRGQLDALNRQLAIADASLAQAERVYQASVQHKLVREQQQRANRCYGGLWGYPGYRRW